MAHRGIFKPNHGTAATFLLAALLCLWTAQCETIRFYDDIKPLLAIHCFKCHTGEKPKGGLLLDSRLHTLAGGKSGLPAIIPGDSTRSPLSLRIATNDTDEQMPPKGARLTAEEQRHIRQWIDEGAHWPPQDDYWAFQPPANPALPAVKSVKGIRNPIDRFINARLEAGKIPAAPEADSRTLLRRAFADLLGVPPTPEETDRFLSDKTPDAFARLTDRLLADPRYGERWARHWLDVVRYGESDGYEDDKIRPQAWRYRDYVIRFLNEDKPYDRFVQEQIAGDELWPDRADAMIATGFARLGAWDGMSKDPAQQRQDFLNDATDAIGAAFLGITLGCARCHDHKYDVISQKDYYRVQAFFAGVKRDTKTLQGPLSEPAFVTTAFKSESQELGRLRLERESLQATARVALETADGAQSGKKKVEDEAIKKWLEKHHPGQFGKLDGAIKSLEQRARFHEPKSEAVFQSGAPRAIRLLKGGAISQPGEEISPGFIEALLPKNAQKAPAQTRAALARWITAADHPLTARVLVNRLWQHHFGNGLVATPSDFGRNGRRPTHPELLDWLARRFVQDGWSVKQMHRLIMTSAAYRRSSSSVPAAYAKDPENRWLWRMNRRRLEGESIRDTFLTLSGTLSPAMGGPGVYAPLPKGVNVEFPNNDKELSWGEATEEEARRRSIYLFQRRSLTFPLMDVFDGAPMNQSCAARPQTTVAPQALALFNGEFARESARHFAERLNRESGSDPKRQIERAFEIAFARRPTRTERDLGLQFLGGQKTARQADLDPQKAALVDFCHMILNANELIYVD